MFRLRTSLPIVCCLLLGAMGMAAPVSRSFKVLVPQDVIDDYNRFVGERSVAELDAYAGKGARRDVIELVLIEQALARANSGFGLELEPMRSYQGILKYVADGKYIMAATSVWLTDADTFPDAFWITDPVIRQGQFEAGFYTASTNHAALATTSLEELAELKAVTNHHWRPDLDTLVGLGLSDIRDVRSWESIVRLLASERADITLAPFNAAPGMRIEMDGCRLIPIPNLKTSLVGERAFVVSRKHPDGDQFFNALRQGLHELEAAGTIERAYRECGFMNPAVADWTVLEPRSD